MLRRAVLVLVFLWFAVGGLAHFVFTGAEAGIVPPWLPDHRALVLASGVCEWVGAAGLLVARLRPAAGWGLVLLTLAVTPANVFMWRHAASYPSVPPLLLALRLPLQALLLLGIWWSTRPARFRRPEPLR